MIIYVDHTKLNNGIKFVVACIWIPIKRPYDETISTLQPQIIKGESGDSMYTTSSQDWIDIQILRWDGMLAFI